VYVVGDGDTLSGIAARFHVRLGDLLRVNDLTITSVIHPGQRLDVPGATAGGPTGGAAYSVSAGDTLSGIAARSGIRLADLLGANDLTVDSLILPGQRLTIPGGGAGRGPTTGSSGATYTVESGDTLSGIAARSGIRLADLLGANDLTVDSLILPGQRLTIPGGGAGRGPTTGSSGATYTVRNGDSLGAIAARHEVALAALLDVNGLSVSSVIHPGTQLTLPVGARVSAVDRVLNYALTQLGKPYKFFTAGPNTFDCSGLTLAAYRQVGITLIHHSASQARQGTAVDHFSEAIRPGDLVFMNTDSDDEIDHVGIALSATTWIQSRRPGDVVRIAQLPPDGAIMAVRRFLPTD
jgi:peptidoglycan endopeptidase LytE